MSLWLVRANLPVRWCGYSFDIYTSPIDFCLRFDDEFNVGSDDWRPDWKRATVDAKGKPHLVILNACVVPSGTFNVCWRDLGRFSTSHLSFCLCFCCPFIVSSFVLIYNACKVAYFLSCLNSFIENRAQWYLIIRWQMRGLDFHLDDNIGRRIKALIGIVTRITGYRGAAPLLATSAEEEDEEFVSESQVQEEITDHGARSKTEAPVPQKQPLSLNLGTSRHRPRRSMTRGLPGLTSDNTSLDDYIAVSRYGIFSAVSLVSKCSFVFILDGC